MGKSKVVQFPHEGRTRETAKEVWQMTKNEYDESLKAKSRLLIEAWNKAGSHGFPPTTGPSIYEVAPLAERAGYVMPRDAEKVLRKPYHRLHVEAAIHEGKPVPSEVLADYPDLQAKTAPISSFDTLTAQYQRLKTEYTEMTARISSGSISFTAGQANLKRLDNQIDTIMKAQIKLSKE